MAPDEALQPAPRHGAEAIRGTGQHADDGADGRRSGILKGLWSVASR